MIQIIPVIDLKDGVVVHAKQGLRDQYQPIASKICRSSDIYEVILAFLGLYDFRDFYIADLNALCNHGNHDRLINDVMAFFPEKRFWLDQGCRRRDRSITPRNNSLLVFGSESYTEKNILDIKHGLQNGILSLDYALTGELGAKSLFSHPDYWPDSVIIMTLTRVGSNSGPDIQLLNEFCQKHPDKNFIAAGGIRNRQDLIALQKIGIKQALMASALHSGAIDSYDIAGLQMPPANAILEK